MTGFVGQFRGVKGAFNVKILQKCALVLPPEPGVVNLTPGLTPPRLPLPDGAPSETTRRGL